MSDPLCGIGGSFGGSFGGSLGPYNTDARWSGMSGMSPESRYQMSQMSQMPQMSLPASLPRQSQLQTGLHQTAGMTSHNSNMVGMSNGTGTSMYGMSASPYGMPPSGASVAVTCPSPLGGSQSPGGGVTSSQMTCGMENIGDMWRGTSIAQLRRKALEHTVSMSGFR